MSFDEVDYLEKNNISYKCPKCEAAAKSQQAAQPSTPPETPETNNIEVEAEDSESERLQWNLMSNQDLRMVMWCSCEKRCSVENWDPAD